MSELSLVVIWGKSLIKKDASAYVTCLAIKAMLAMGIMEQVVDAKYH